MTAELDALIAKLNRWRDRAEAAVCNTYSGSTGSFGMDMGVLFPTIIAALTQARVDREEVERLRDKHHPDCDALAREPNGIVKPCNCFLTRVANLYLRIEALAKGLENLLYAIHQWRQGGMNAEGCQLAEVAARKALTNRTAAAKEGT